MAIQIEIAEAPSLLRICAALSTSLSTSSKFNGSIDLGLSSGIFFRSFPWSGEIVVHEGIPDYEQSTVGQFFSEFNWEGKIILFGNNQGTQTQNQNRKQNSIEKFEDILGDIFDEGD